VNEENPGNPDENGDSNGDPNGDPKWILIIFGAPNPNAPPAPLSGSSSLYCLH